MEAAHGQFIDITYNHVSRRSQLGSQSLHWKFHIVAHRTPLTEAGHEATSLTCALAEQYCRLSSSTVESQIPETETSNP